MKFHLTIIFLLITSLLFAQQNLVPNPSFEEFSSCPTGISQLDHSVPWFSPNIPPICPGGTPDYFNQCDTSFYPLNAGVPGNGFGNEQAKTGVAYAGLYTMNLPFENGREYIEVPLNDTLVAKEKYIVSFYVSFAEVMGYATNKIGAYFSDTAIVNSCDTLLPYSPQIQNTSANPLTNKNGWTLVSDTFIADGGEAYMIIGNFNTVAQSDTVFVGGGTWGNTCCSYYYIDDVSVTPYDSISGLDVLVNNYNSINIFANPARNELTLDFTLTDKCFFELYNVVGAKRMTVTLDSGSQTKNIYLTDIDSGLYFYSVVDRKGNRLKTGKLIVIK